MWHFKDLTPWIFCSEIVSLEGSNVINFIAKLAYSGEPKLRGNNRLKYFDATWLNFLQQHSISNQLIIFVQSEFISGFISAAWHQTMRRIVWRRGCFITFADHMELHSFPLDKVISRLTSLTIIPRVFSVNKSRMFIEVQRRSLKIFLLRLTWNDLLIECSVESHYVANSAQWCCF